jgi:hypothetical protein
VKWSKGKRRAAAIVPSTGLTNGSRGLSGDGTSGNGAWRSRAVSTRARKGRFQTGSVPCPQLGMSRRRKISSRKSVIRISAVVKARRP